MAPTPSRCVPASAAPAPPCAPSLPAARAILAARPPYRAGHLRCTPHSVPPLVPRPRPCRREVKSRPPAQAPAFRARASAQGPAPAGATRQPNPGGSRAAAGAGPGPIPAEDARDARGVVEAFYSAINARDVGSALGFIAEHCLYEDMIYPQPFRGRQEISQHFEKVLLALPGNFSFVIDEITDYGGLSVGLTWHVEVGGSRLPFSRGCSFYRCGTDESKSDGPLKIVYARDIPEPSVKPGNITLNILSAVAFVLQRLSPQK